MHESKHYYASTLVILSFLLTMSAWSITAGIWLERWVLGAADVGPRIWIATTTAFIFSVISVIAGRGFFRDLAVNRSAGRELAITFWQSVLVVVVMIFTGTFIVWTSSWMDKL